MLRRWPCALISIGALLAPAAAAAQGAPGVFEVFPVTPNGNAFDVQLFEPSTSPRSIITLDTAQIPSHLSLTLGLWTSYAHRPFVVDPAGGGDAQPIVQNLFQTELHGSLGLFNYFEVGLAVPGTLTGFRDLAMRHSDCAGMMLCTAFRPGDLRMYVKVPLLRGPVEIALRGSATAPLVGRDAFAGNVSWTFTPALVVSRTFGPVAATVNVGFRLRDRNGISAADEMGRDASFVLDDELIWGAGARWNITPRVAVNAEAIGRIGISVATFDAQGRGAVGLVNSRTPVELLAGGTFQVTDWFSLNAGVGRGISGGYGTPEIRGFLGARITATRAQCTSGPEDYDGFQDGDYCADPDNDQDGIPDTVDRCVNDAEDRDGFLDTDGCPDPDNDADAVNDDDDRCPTVPEDRDSFEDTDGCPEGDNDRDGVPDGTDDCPMEPEDVDRFQDEDGCPEPGPDAVVVTRTETHLLLSQRVFFDYDSDTIRSVSLPILNEVAVTLRRNPDITRVRIEGYTDGHGPAAYNLDLSYRRARAVVEYLVSQSVPRDHLEYQGYGSTHPVADDSTPEGQALNRRVEFTILSQGGRHPTPTTPGGGGGNTAPSTEQGGAAAPTPSDAGGGRRRRRRGGAQGGGATQ